MSKKLIDTLRKAEADCFPFALTSLPEYSDWRKEQMASKEAVCIGNWSFAAWAFIEGPGATQLLSDYSINSFENCPVGQVKHLVGTTEKGKVIGEGICMKVGENKYKLATLPWWQYIASQKKYDVTLTMEPPGTTSIYQVCGPKSIELLEEVANESLRDIKFMHFRTIKIGGREVMATNGLTMSGEVGFELHYPAKYDHDVLDTVLEAGKKLGVCRLGSRTSMQHVEACFPTMGIHYLPALFDESLADFNKFLDDIGFNFFIMKWKIAGSYEGSDIQDYFLSPIEMGWASHIKFDHEFMGKKALEEEIKNPRKKVVTLELNMEDILDVYASYFKEDEPYEFINFPHQAMQMIQADTVSKDGEFVGISTTPLYSYYFRKVLTLAFVDVNVNLGDTVEVLWGNPGSRQKVIKATIAPAPYKSDKRRINLNTFSK